MNAGQSSARSAWSARARLARRRGRRDRSAPRDGRGLAGPLRSAGADEDRATGPGGRRGPSAAARARSGRVGCVPASLGANASMRSNAIVKPAYSSGASAIRCARAVRSGNTAALRRASSRLAKRARSAASASPASLFGNLLRQRDPVQQAREVAQRLREREAARLHLVGQRHAAFASRATSASSTPLERACVDRAQHLLHRLQRSPCRRRTRSSGRAATARRACCRVRLGRAGAAPAGSNSTLSACRMSASLPWIPAGVICLRLNCRQRTAP